MGRFQADQQAGPDQAATTAYLEAQAAGQDGRAAALGAWKRGVADLTERMGAKGYTPANVGESNLQAVTANLRAKGVDPVAATAMAMEFLAAQAQQPPSPAAPPPVPPTRVPTGVTSI